jgi:nitrate reductase gamma subunit
MELIMWLYILVYLSVFLFAFGVARKIVKYSRMPIHLRWEIYPIAHESGHKSGGSYMEDLDWQERLERKSLYGELIYMAREILLFTKCYRNNRALWYLTYPFHLGLFLLIIWSTLLIAAAIIEIAGPTVSMPSNVWTSLIYYLILITGIAGIILSTSGCIGLLIKRIVNENLRIYTSPIDYFNLSFIIVILLSLLTAWFLSNSFFADMIALVKSIFVLSPVEKINPAMVVNVVLFCLFLTYMPLTNMIHGVAKYYTYHRVFWDDEPNVAGNNIGDMINKLMDQRITWAAVHIQPDKKWREILHDENRQKHETAENKRY